MPVIGYMTEFAKAEQDDAQFHIHIAYMMTRRLDIEAIATTPHRDKLRVGVSHFGVLKIKYITNAGSNL
jgi:outer membrane protein W